MSAIAKKLIVYGDYMDTERVRQDFGRMPDRVEVGWLIGGHLMHIHQPTAPDGVHDYVGFVPSHAKAPVMCLVLTFNVESDTDYEEMMGRVDDIEWATEERGFLYRREQLQAETILGSVTGDVYILSLDAVRALERRSEAKIVDRIATESCVSWPPYARKRKLRSQE